MGGIPLPHGSHKEDKELGFVAAASLVGFRELLRLGLALVFSPATSSKTRHERSSGWQLLLAHEDSLQPVHSRQNTARERQPTRLTSEPTAQAPRHRPLSPATMPS